MSDSSISIVPKQSNYPNNKEKAVQILNWLVSKDIVKSELSDCILSSDNGYEISKGAAYVTTMPEDLPFDLQTNGLEIITTKQVFDTGENGMDECICPNCHEDIAEEEWDFFSGEESEENYNMKCPKCDVTSDINKFEFSPEWGFNNLGFTFWNWPDLSVEFIEEFKEKLGCEVAVVYSHI